MDKNILGRVSRGLTGTGQLGDVSVLGAKTPLHAVERFRSPENLGVPMRTGDLDPRLTPLKVYAAATL
jgi:hypothetical protein